MKPKVTVPECLNGSITNDRTSIENDIIAQQFIKNVVSKTSTENEEYSVITLENYTIKTEPETNVSETLVSGIVDDRSCLGIGDKVTEPTTKPLLKNNSVSKKHKRTHKKDRHFNCDICGNTFSSLSALTVHRRSHTGEKPYSCTKCIQTFSDKSALNIHMKLHSGEKPYTCPQCKSSFALKTYLYRHMRGHTGVKPYTCTECKQSFTRNDTLKRHMRRHTGEKPHSCTECGKSFVSKKELKIHMRRHTGEKPYSCTKCNKKFVAKVGLNLHIKRHIDEKPNVCLECGKRFILACELRYHSKTHLRLFACDECDEKFKTNEKLVKHIRIHSSKRKRENKAQKHKFKFMECNVGEEELKNHYDRGDHINEYTSSSLSSLDSVKALNSQMLEVNKKHTKTLWNDDIGKKLKRNGFESSLIKINKIDDSKEISTENIVNTVNNKSKLQINYDEEISLKIGRDIVEKLLLKNKLKPKSTNNQTLIASGFITQQFFKEEESEIATKSLPLENQLYTVITLENATIKTEPESTTENFV